MSKKKKKQLVNRISISLPDDLQIKVDDMVIERGFNSRSQAINDMLRQHVADHQTEIGNEVMAGTITILYDNSRRGLQKKLSDLQYENLNEVISSLHVNLMNNQTMEVILVQGPAQKVQKIADHIITLPGVVTGRLQLMAAVLPPVYSITGEI